jgi:cytochrome c-type biogenesis protein CcmH
MVTKNKDVTWIGLSILLLICLIPVSVSAQGSGPTDDEVNAVAKQLYCPVCENIPLDACGTQACEQWRGIIRDKLAEGWTEDQIKDYFVAQYGDRVLAEPPRQGFNWIVYVVPIVIFVGGGILFYRGFQQWRTSGQDSIERRAEKKVSSPGKPSDEDIKRVEEELMKRAKG